MRTLFTRTLWAACGLALLGFLAATAEPGARLLLLSIDWIGGAGAAGLALFVVVYAVATWLMVPASWLQMAAGFLYGPVVGFVVAVGCSTGFGSVSFGLARTSLRGPVERRLSRGGWLVALDSAVAEGGAGMVALLRLSPLSPYNVVNYALGLTGVRFRDYVLGTLAGSSLPLVLYALLGASAGDLAALLAGEATAPAWIQWIGLSVTVLATLGVTARVRHSLRRRGITSTGSEAPLRHHPSASSSSLCPARH